jgi:serine/threonine-protein kinase
LAHDPTFFQAYCHLAWVHDYLYLFRFDRSPERLARAQAAVDAAFRLRPTAGEAHLARANHLYCGHLDDNGVLSELDLASQALPNDSRVFELKGYVERRRPGANEEDALPDLHRAVELDPRNVSLLQQTAITYRDLRRYAEEQAVVDRILAIEPNDVERRTWRAFVDLNWKADTQPLHQLIDSVRATIPDALPRIAEEWLICALAEHDAAAAASALTILGEHPLGNELIKYSRHFIEGLIARMAKDDVKAHAAFDAARAEQEKLVGAHPDDAGALCVLGLIDAALGRKEEALREGRRAVELLPIEKDPRQGPRVLVCFAMIAGWAGDNNLACDQLGNARRYSTFPPYGQLKLLPFWDPLRGDPCFEKIVASLAPK